MVEFHFVIWKRAFERGERFGEKIWGGAFGCIVGLREGGWMKFLPGVSPFQVVGALGANTFPIWRGC